MNQEIWVVCDENPEENAAVSLGMLTKAGELRKQSGCRTTAVCFGRQTQESMEELFYYGAERVLHINHEQTGTEAQCRFLCEAIKHYSPRMIMFPASEYGRRMASYTSVEFEAGLTAECIEIGIGRDGRFEYSRAAINSSAIATIRCINSDIELCTVKENIFIPQRLSVPCKGEIEEFRSKDTAADILSDKITVMSREKKAAAQFDVNSSRIVFGFGRGIKDAETVSLLFRVANKIGASVVGTRAVVEDHLIEQFRQVGQSGISIAPEIYVCFGVSGASQHIVGIKNAKVIVAVNTDEHAPIFDYADYIIHDDAANVLLKLEEHLLNC